MQLTFFGTAAANAFPEPFCHCDHCQQARREGGRSIRKRSAALIDEELLIDLGPDILTAANQYGRSLMKVRYCLQTHAHADHLDASHLLSRSPGYGVGGAPHLHFYASEGTLRQLQLHLGRDLGDATLLDPEVSDRLNVTFHPIKAWQTFSAGRYQILALPADHDAFVEPLLYVITADGRSIFYGTDTASLDDAIWQTFHQQGYRFDLVILDHTYGPDQQASDHLSAAEVRAYTARLRLEGLLTPEGRVFATHIAHEGNPAYSTLRDYAATYGYEIAYDGLTV